MKLFKTLLTILFISLLSSPSWSEEMGDLVERDGIYYQKSTDVPFTGKVTGKEQGLVKNGKRDGVWIGYHENGKFGYIKNYKNGKAEGALVSYYENGQLWFQENFKNGKRDGAWVDYHRNGQLSLKENYRNGKREGASVSYWMNGQLGLKGNYKKNKKEGSWIGYHGDGTVWKKWTGTYKNGLKISD